MPYDPKTLALLAAVLGTLLGEAARAAEAPAPSKIVSTVCARCHDVDSPSGWSPRPDAPGFAQVARENPAYVEGVLQRPPRAMWGVKIEDRDKAEIRAHFARLRALEAVPRRDGK